MKRGQTRDSTLRALPFCAAPRMLRNLCPTITSSPGWMVIETSSMWSASGRSLRVGFGLPSRTVFTRLGLSAPSTSMTGSPARKALHAVGDGKSPGVLIPGDFSAWDSGSHHPECRFSVFTPGTVSTSFRMLSTRSFHSR